MDAIITRTYFRVKKNELLVSDENKETSRFYRYYKYGSSTTVILLENNYILRISKFDDVQLYKKFAEFLPKMYLSGNIYSETGIELGYYFLVERIYDYDKIEKLSLDMKFIFLKELLLILIKLEKLDYIYRDFKLENVGFTGPDENTVTNVKILDFDDITLLKEDDFFTKNLIKNKRITWYTTGTYPPLYMTNEINLKKIPVGGLVIIILQLFYGYNQIIHLIHESLSYNLDNFKKIKNKVAKKIEKLEPIELLKKDDLIIKNIITKLFSLNVSSLPEYEDIYSSIMEFNSLI